MKTPKKIVILGGGFAGVYSALSILKNTSKNDVEITIVNKTNYFLFTPMLHEVATGGLGHHNVVESIRGIIYKTPIRFLEAEVASVEIPKNEIKTSRGTYGYDILVVALGATTNFFGTPGASENVYVLKDLSDAIKIREQIIESFESASRTKDEEQRKKLLSFVVVGGGATGVELSAEIAELSRRSLKKYYQKEFPSDIINITLVQNAPELLPVFSAETRARALQSLKEKGVSVMLNAKVISIDSDSVTLESGQKIFSNTIVWTAGVKPNSIKIEGGEFKLDSVGRIMADKSLRVSGIENIYALGDVAYIPNELGKPYPMLAQIAVAEAKHLGKNIGLSLNGGTLKDFSYKSKGELVSLGQWEAAGSIGKINLYGKFAWFIWRTTYLFKFISKSKKLKIAADWTVHIFFPRDVTSA